MYHSATVTFKHKFSFTAALANRQYRKCQSTGNEFDQGATYACPATSICLRNLTTGTGGTIVATGTNYNIIADPTATAGPCAPKIPCNGTGSFGFGPQGIFNKKYLTVILIFFLINLIKVSNFILL